MIADALIQKRFDELQAKVQDVRQTREESFHDKGRVHYTIPYSEVAGWATNVLSLLERTFGDSSVHFTEFRRMFVNFRDWESEFDNCVAVFSAAKEDYEGGYLFNVRSLVKAEVLVDAIDQARDLLKAGYKDPACILGRVSLEVTLKELCVRNGQTIANLDKMNSDLCKMGIYNMAKQKQITAWADIGNKAAHGDWAGYDQDDVVAFIDGVERFIADHL